MLVRAHNNRFINNTGYYGGAIYANGILIAFDFKNNVYEDNFAYDGGAILMTSISNFSPLKKTYIIEFASKTVTPSLKLDGDTYTRNTAIRNGGALSVDWESLFINKATFEENKGKNGGALYIVNIGINLLCF